MKLLYVLFTYNRPKVLSKCIETLFLNNGTVPDELLIIDDGSRPETRIGVIDFVKQNCKSMPITLFSFATNQGLGYQWERAYKYIEERNPEKVAFIEQDYIFRKGGMDEAVELLNLYPQTMAISLYSNPDYYSKEKTEGLFPRIMKEDFGSDSVPRQFLHKPFKVTTKFGDIECQWTSNSCGTFMMNWHRVKSLIEKYPEMRQTCLERAFNLPFPERRKYAGDGPLTSGFTFFFYKDALDRGLDVEKNGPWLDVCDYSIAEHLNGGQDSLNGYIIPEMSTFVGSPKWKFEYLNKNPRL